MLCLTVISHRNFGIETEQRRLHSLLVSPSASPGNHQLQAKNMALHGNITQKTSKNRLVHEMLQAILRSFNPLDFATDDSHGSLRSPNRRLDGRRNNMAWMEKELIGCFEPVENIGQNYAEIIQKGWGKKV